MMDDVGRYCWGAAAVLALAFLGMIFSAAEAAIAACSESRLRRQSEEGDSRAGLLLEAKERQAAFSLWAQVSASVCLLSADVFGTVFFAPALLPWLESWIPNPVWAKWVSWGGVFLLLSFLLLVLGVALPKKLSLYAPDKTAFGMQGAVKILSRIFCPLTWLILKTTRLLLRLLGKNPDQETDEITEEEIRMMVDAGKEQGAIELSEREMINNIFEFDDRTVGEVMTHRTDISAVPPRFQRCWRWFWRRGFPGSRSMTAIWTTLWGWCMPKICFPWLGRNQPMEKQPGITSARSFIRRSPPAAGCCSGSLKSRRCIWP